MFILEAIKSHFKGDIISRILHSWLFLIEIMFILEAINPISRPYNKQNLVRVVISCSLYIDDDALVY